MRKLENTQEDRQYLNNILSTGLLPKAKIEMGMFTSQLASSLKIVSYYGKITSIDIIDGYCHWVCKGINMPCVNIGTITLI